LRKTNSPQYYLLDPETGIPVTPNIPSTVTTPSLPTMQRDTRAFSIIGDFGEITPIERFQKRGERDTRKW
jgi:hypothetical protein